jgi:hypothetical protein
MVAVMAAEAGIADWTAHALPAARKMPPTTPPDSPHPSEWQSPLVAYLQCSYSAPVLR